MTKFNLEQQADDISVTKFLGQRSNDIVVTMFNLDTTVTKFLDQNEITIIEFLDTLLPQYLEENDISVTKFLDATITKFLEQQADDISVTKFLAFDDQHHGAPDYYSHYGGHGPAPHHLGYGYGHGHSHHDLSGHHSEHGVYGWESDLY